jgi:2-polyprenyl-6-methoxyphenol hydroxylase-like FAD-dependent oxidoreductase
MKLLISGGGIAGLTLAFWLHSHGHEPLVVEKSSRLRDEGYMIDFFGPGYEASEKMSILSEIEGIHYQIPRLAFLGPSGKERFSLGYATLRKNLFGDRHFNFMRGDLERLLYSKIEDRVEVRLGTEVASFEQDGAQVRVKLTNGSTDTFDVLVGADGVHSRTRQLAFGPDDSFERPLGYYTAAFIVDDPKIREGVGDAFYTLTVPGRQVAVYPIRGDRLATFFIHKAEHRLYDFSQEMVREELYWAYGGMGWIVPELLERCLDGGGVYFDELAQVEMPSWRRGRVVLVGDACGCVSLLAGQGASMAMSGAYTLAEELAEVREEEDMAGALARYEGKLKPPVEKRQQAGLRMARWFVPDNRAILAVRDAAMRMTTSSLASLLLRYRFASGNTMKL